MKNSAVVFPCRVRRGFFAFIAIFAVGVIAAPQVDYSIVKSGLTCKVRVSGSSIGFIKSGELVCEYTAQLDIDDALVYSPLSSIVVEASVDRVNHRVKIVINTTGKVAIDKVEVIVIELKLSGSETEPLFRLTNAVFTDSQGLVRNAQILPVGIISGSGMKSPAQNAGRQVSKLFLLNGKTVPVETAERFRKEFVCGDVFLRIVKQR